VRWIKTNLAGLIALAVCLCGFSLQVNASEAIFAKADRRCVACHKRTSFKEPRTEVKDGQVHIGLQEFTQDAHARLSCGSCHTDFRKVRHPKDADRRVDCVSCHRRHPEFVLRDRAGEPVLETGQPLSTMRTCGVCHDTKYIASSSDHADAGASHLFGEDRPDWWIAGRGYYGGWDPIRYDVVLDESGQIDKDAWLKRYGQRHVGGGPVDDRVEMDCLLCHTDVADHSMRSELMARGDFAWANAAPLQSRDIVDNESGEWQWNPVAFQADGRLHVGLLDIRNPGTEKCGHCHGLASSDPATPLEFVGGIRNYKSTNTTGQIIAPHSLGSSGLNFAEGEDPELPLDLHASRGLQCENCHYLLNDPVYFQGEAAGGPDHMMFDPRRPGLNDFLDRPTHQVAKGRSIFGLAAEDSINSLRTCKTCHDPSEAHDWLPYQERHFETLSCQACHISRVRGPALKAIDWTVVDESGEPLRQYRGVDGDDPDAEDAVFTGYRPALLPRQRTSEDRELTPFNGVNAWFWLTGDPQRPVSREELRRALLQDGGHHPELVAALDQNDDQRLDRSELELTTAAQTEPVRKRLEAIGLTGLSIKSETTLYPIYHNVGAEDFATRECRTCHYPDSLLHAAFPLTSYLPGGVTPEAAHYATVEMRGSLATGGDGEVSGVPDLRQSGYYILGLHNVPFVDWLGLIIFIGVILGVAAHGLIRFLTRRQRQKRHPELQRVFMYTKYERLWHWTQAAMILSLIFTGLVIHNPHLFGDLSFPHMVSIHNAFGLILLVNAALALFYNLTSGRFQQYLPEPKDFFTRAIMQALYYTRGIFRGEPHPFEKTRDKHLNPLQEFTYFMILNLLLPAQVITGIMIYWGQQNWPIYFSALGGLPVLAPVHTAIAWLFSAFVVLHVYLVTTSGHTSMAAIKSMITGWEDIEQRPTTPAPPDQDQEST
jgi:thiosulfate reductase cytochrome b subunit